MIQDLQPMMHLVACLGGKTLVSFQGDGDPPQKKKKKKAIEILLARGLA